MPAVATTTAMVAASQGKPLGLTPPPVPIFPHIVELPPQQFADLPQSGNLRLQRQSRARADWCREGLPVGPVAVTVVSAATVGAERVHTGQLDRPAQRRFAEPWQPRGLAEGIPRHAIPSGFSPPQRLLAPVNPPLTARE